jgi:quercetin dioxygenase-like cupin family protein
MEGTMSRTLAGSLAPLLGALGFFALPSVHLAAQYPRPSLARQFGSAWESNRIRVRTVSVEPGARLAAPQDGADRVLIFLTADLDGRMPAAATWQPAGEPEPVNRGRLRVDAIVVDLKPGTAGAGGGTPLESTAVRDRVDARVLIDNARVAVMKLRYLPYPTSLEQAHDHPQDALVVYLAGGYTWLPDAGWGYPAAVRRGEFSVVPAHTLHSFGNAGGDALEVLLIVPK